MSLFTVLGLAAIAIPLIFFFGSKLDPGSHKMRVKEGVTNVPKSARYLRTFFVTVFILFITSLVLVFLSAFTKLG